MNDPIPNEDRRTAVRKYFPTPTGEVVLWVSFDHWIPGQLMDESPGGIAVAVLSNWHFELDFEVQVETKQGKRMAAITSVNELDDGQVRIGMKWVNSFANYLGDG